MVIPSRLVLLLAILTPLVVVAPGAAQAPVAAPHTPAAATSAAPAAPAAPAASRASGSPAINVAVANVREGSLVRMPADLRAGGDRAAFARRVLDRPGPAPDVVLVQEVLGTAGLVAGALDAVQRSRGLPDRYTVVDGAAQWRAAGRCDGPRNGRFSVLRSSAVLVNTTTVTRVAAHGVIRTWGRWNRVARPLTGRDGFGCTEHPWARLVVRTDAGPVSATVLSLHAAPLGIALKNQALATVTRGLAALPASEVSVVGGDANLTRCRDHRDGPSCSVHPGHQGLIDAGYRDVVLDGAPSGAEGVAGVDRRIDFLYVRGSATDAWWDRCYQAFRVRQWPCGTRAVFDSRPRFVACQTRALQHGSAGGGCGLPSFRTYYSDHPLVTGVVGPAAS